MNLFLIHRISFLVPLKLSPFSRMSLFLSGLTSVFGNFELEQLSTMSGLVAFSWLLAAWRLSNLVPTREEAEKAHQKDKLKKG